MKSSNSFGTDYERKNIVTALINLLPDKTKRWIFISSFFALVQDKKDIDYETDIELIKHINETFNISVQPKACLFSMKIKNFIWKDIPKKIKLDNEEVDINELGKKHLSEKELETVGNFIKNIIPSWLAYDSSESFINDVRLLIKQIPSIA